MVRFTHPTALERLAPGSRIVSHQFEIRGIKPDKVIEMKSKEDRHKHTLFVRTTPLRKQKADRAK
jgi:hypothetical protein